MRVGIGQWMERTVYINSSPSYHHHHHSSHHSSLPRPLLVIYPVDVVKSHVQTSQNIGGKSSTGYETAVRLYRTHGLGVFTRGLGVCLLRAFPVNAVVFYALESLKLKFGIR